MWWTGVVAVIGVLVTIGKFIFGLWSPAARLHRIELWLERQRTAAKVEAERVEAEYDRIDQQPDKRGQDLIDDLNEKFKG